MSVARPTPAATLKARRFLKISLMVGLLVLLNYGGRLVVEQINFQLWPEHENLMVTAFCERLDSLSDEDSVRLLDEAHRGAALGATGAQSVFLAMGWALFEPRLSPRRSALGAAARRAELRQVADFVAPPLEDDEDVEDKRRVPDFGRGRPLTLGERKSLARTHDRSLIQRVVRDPHPDVVRILLDNPSLTEEDVVRVCAARPNQTLSHGTVSSN